MSLQPGQTLAHFKIESKLGQGGMGEVWKAVDTTLGRDVAIKILPENFAADAERLARFEREARLLASLNHPHIAGIFGIHEAATPGGPLRFLSMELVPGEDLAAVLERGPLPIDRALRVAREIAEALETAHDSGVIHRDLKPANVKLTLDGKAKVLDFGLAKAYDPQAASDPARSQTMTSAGTMAGLILGTAAYMSPEQASGQPTDRRCDIWSFGVVLFEMLTAKRMFGGETVSHTLADVLRAPIDLAELPAGVPASIRRLIERCLTRDRMRRLRDMGEARIAIEEAIANPASSGEAPVATAVARASRLPWIMTAVALAAATVAIVVRPGATKAIQEPVRRFALEVPPEGSTRQGDGLGLAISSTGALIVMRGGAGAESMLYMRRIDDFELRPIEGTANGYFPFFSPDDQWIGFVDVQGLRKVRVGGGPSQFVARAPSSPDGIDWAEDGFIYFSRQGAIWRVSQDGGEPESVVEVADGRSRGLMFPFLMPGATTILCSSRGGAGLTGSLFAVDMKTKDVKDLEMAGTNPRWLPTGHVMFAQSDRVFVAPFDREKLAFTGPPTPVHPRAWVDQGQIQLGVAADGTVAYLPRARGETQQLVSVGLDGKVEPLLSEALPFRGFSDPRVSRDGRQLLISTDGGAIWMIDLDTQTPTLMSESGFYPLWSPDGSEILFATTRNRSFDIYRRPIDLSRPEELVLDVDNNLRSAEWTRQGQILIREEIAGKGMDLRLWADPADPKSLVNLLDGPDDELAPTVSRDGKWLAYVSNYSGGDEIYVTSFPKPGAKIKISVKGGSSPVWAPDGSAIYYFDGRQLIEAAIETEPRFRVLGRRALFEGDYVQYRWSRQFDITPDGKRFVLVKNPPRGNVEVVTRWFDELSPATH